jgi:undecaprenyl-diphosphatase
MRQAAFVINPLRARHVELLKARCRQAAARNGWEALFMGTEAGETGPELSSHLEVYAGQPGDKLVFAVGGDGTVRACAHVLAGSGIALAIVPRGTANLFARALGVPSDLAGALSTGFCGLDLDVDVPDADGQTFVAMAGLGIDAAVVQGTSKLLKDYLGWLAYALAALPYLAGPVHEITVEVDGAGPMVRNAHCVVVGNVGLLPGGFNLLKGARVDDGLLDVGVLSPHGVVGWLVVARRTVGGRHRTGPELEHFQGSRIEVSSTTELCRQLDGDVIAPGRSLSVHLRARALRVRVPERHRIGE